MKSAETSNCFEQKMDKNFEQNPVRTVSEVAVYFKFGK